jgi:hypothetical protein
MKSQSTNYRAASRRRNYPRPTLYAPGITRRDRLFLWYLAYRLPVRKLPFEADLSFQVLAEACRKCRYPQWRLEEIRYDYPEAWDRMLAKRAHRICGTKDPQRTDGRVRGASMTDTMCRHPRIARAIGWPYYGSYSKLRNYAEPLRAGEVPPYASPRQVFEPQKEADSSEIAERDDRTAIRIDGMTEPTAGAERPNDLSR